MQSEYELKLADLKQRCNELDAELEPHFEAYFQSQTELVQRESREHYRQVELYRYHKYSLQEASNFLYVLTVSALKSIEDLVPQCNALINELNIFLEDDQLGAEDRASLTEMYIALVEAQEYVENGIEAYAGYYRNADAPIKVAIHEAFTDHKELAAWFQSHLNAIEAREIEENEQREAVEFPSVLVRHYFQNSGVSAMPNNEDSDEHIDSEEDSSSEENPFSPWIQLLEDFNSEVSGELLSYAEEVDMYANYCSRFNEMSGFTRELRVVLAESSENVKTLPLDEQDHLNREIEGVSKHVALLEEYIELLSGLMRHLARSYEENKHHLPKLLCRVMRFWANPNHQDPLGASARVMEGAERKRQLLSVIERRHSF